LATNAPATAVGRFLLTIKKPRPFVRTGLFDSASRRLKVFKKVFFAIFFVLVLGGVAVQSAYAGQNTCWWADGGICHNFNDNTGYEEGAEDWYDEGDGSDGNGGPPLVPPSADSCPAPRVTPGAIRLSAVKIAPQYPLVIGQDESKRGVDARWEVSVAPTSYVTWRLEPEYDRVCGPLAQAWHTSNCTQDGGGPGRWRDEQVGWRCEASTSYFSEVVSSVNFGASLAQSSRDWILTGDLQRKYPGARLYNPDISFVSSAANWRVDGGGVYHLVLEEARIPFADPGRWQLLITGQTSGTSSQSPRNFSGTGGTR
jgi:hypothetical protein